ncbi:hypothetical protein TrVFT333_007243 [Trichoderma virens FT-333]|nr:hypothetical protein TrVFT333_007243 [Trichoderma virens FT-333]
MSASTRNLLGRVRRMVPPMLDTFHKGQLGRVAVIGGSEDYTGAPYFSAMASARLGCDMSHVICTPAAAAVIKTYSPNLMVHPLMRQSPPQKQASQDDDPDSNPDHVSRKIIEMLGRLHVLVVGPGLGRDPLMQATVARVIKAARESNMPVVLDADALQIVQNDPDIVRGYKYAVLTPNVVEFKRLCDALKIDIGHQSSETGKVEALAKELGGVTIIEKGQKDFISNGKVTLAYLDGLWKDHEQPALDADEMMGLAAFGGSAVTRECSRLAFVKRGRSLQASDLTDEVHTAFMGLFGEVDGETDAAKL